ncbi:MAG: DUF523 domain-containing protein [Candidatus Omnitrophota bacterium]
MPKKILVSSCLTGKKCSYDGKTRTNNRIIELCVRRGCIDVCPEIEGGLGCPRERHEIDGGDGADVLEGRARVISLSGSDHTENFLKGAEATLKKALENGVSLAIMKARSPSCGAHKIHSGKFDGTLKSGSGVTTALLKRHDIRVFTEEEVEEGRF